MEKYLEQLTAQIPLELFVMIGSFLEEIIAPIPSPFIMTTAAVIAVERSYGYLGFAVLAVLGAVGKTIASWIVYVVADKGEDIVIKKYGAYFGVTHQRIEKIGALFARGWWDDAVLFFLRAVPIVPTFLVSVVSGVIKLNMRTYIFATFFGTIVRNCAYMLIGIYGIDAVALLQVVLTDSYIVVGALIVLAIIGWFTLSAVKKKISNRVLEENE